MIILKMINIGKNIPKKTLEEDNWLDEYQKYFSNSVFCLDLGCYIGQYTKKIMSHGLL